MRIKIKIKNILIFDGIVKLKRKIKLKKGIQRKKTIKKEWRSKLKWKIKIFLLKGKIEKKN